MNNLLKMERYQLVHNRVYWGWNTWSFPTWFYNRGYLCTGSDGAFRWCGAITCGYFLMGWSMTLLFLLILICSILFFDIRTGIYMAHDQSGDMCRAHKAADLCE